MTPERFSEVNDAIVQGMVEAGRLPTDLRHPRAQGVLDRATFIRAAGVSVSVDAESFGMDLDFITVTAVHGNARVTIDIMSEWSGEVANGVWRASVADLAGGTLDDLDDLPQAVAKARSVASSILEEGR